MDLDYTWRVIIWVAVLFVILGVGWFVRRNVQDPHRIVWSLWHIRFSVVAALLMLSLPLAASDLAPSMLSGLFIVDGWANMFHLTWISLALSTTILSTGLVTLINGNRFGLEPGSASSGSQSSEPMPATEWLVSTWTFAYWSAWLAIGWWLPLWAFINSISEDDDLGTMLLGGVAVGTAFAIFLLAILSLLQEFLLPDEMTAAGLLPFENFRPWGTASGLRPLFELLTWLFHGPGMTRPIPPREGSSAEGEMLAPGHAQLALLTCAFLAAYLGFFFYYQYSGSAPGERDWWPAIFYVIVLIIIFNLILSGMAFFLDLYRIPTSAILAGVTAFNYFLLGTDHFFHLVHPESESNAVAATPLPAEPAAPAKASSAPPATNPVTMEEFFSRRKVPAVGPASEPRQRTLVVVTAAGGGIHAAAWTAKVLTELDYRYEGFGDSIGLVSSVSGGSVGAMYFVSRRYPRPSSAGANWLSETDRDIMTDATSSSLETLSWGVAVPDTIRMFVPPLVPREFDRGNLLERAWQDRLGEGIRTDPKWKNATLRDWAADVREGIRPAVAFNSTLAETGQRFLLSPLRFSSPAAVSKLARDPVEFWDLYEGDGIDLRVVTAARLSATFPYVTPTARDSDSLAKRHVADGGYSDNDGVVTALRFLGQMIAHLEDPKRVPLNPSQRLPIDRILLVRIVPFPEDIPPADELSGGLTQALLGPVLTTFAVRSASQAERGSLEIQLFEDAREIAINARQRAATEDVRLALAETEGDPQINAIPELKSKLDPLRESLKTSMSANMHQMHSALGQKPSMAEKKWTKRPNAGTPAYAKQAAAALDAAKRQPNFPMNNSALAKLNRLDSAVKKQQSEAQLALPFEFVNFQYQPKNGEEIPLSWKLTRAQKENVESAWRVLVDESALNSPAASDADSVAPKNPLRILDRYFNKRDTSKASNFPVTDKPKR